MPAPVISALPTKACMRGRPWSPIGSGFPPDPGKGLDYRHPLSGPAVPPSRSPGSPVSSPGASTVPSGQPEPAVSSQLRTPPQTVPSITLPWGHSASFPSPPPLWPGREALLVLTDWEEAEIYWRLERRGQECCSGSAMGRTPHHEDLSCRLSINSAELRKPCSRALKSLES